MNKIKKIYNKLAKYNIIKLSNKKKVVLQYECLTGKKIDIDKPITFNEKIQWLKIYDHNPLYPTMVDKYDAKKYIGEKIGKQYIIKNYGIYNNFDEIDFDKLPDKFVMKCTHDSGTVYICEDKNEMNKNIKKIKKEFKNALKNNFYDVNYEWQYKDLKRRIIIEELLENSNKEKLKDYKVWCFDGVPQMVNVVEHCNDNIYGVVSNYYDLNWKQLELKFKFPLRKEKFKKPINYKKMLEISKTLSAGLPLLRVDFYEKDDQLYIGELTLYHGAGYSEITPKIFEKQLGDAINLDMVKM